ARSADCGGRLRRRLLHLGSGRRIRNVRASDAALQKHAAQDGRRAAAAGAVARQERGLREQAQTTGFWRVVHSRQLRAEGALEAVQRGQLLVGKTKARGQKRRDGTVTL